MSPARLPLGAEPAGPPISARSLLSPESPRRRGGTAGDGDAADGGGGGVQGAGTRDGGRRRGAPTRALRRHLRTRPPPLPIPRDPRSPLLEKSSMKAMEELSQLFEFMCHAASLLADDDPSDDASPRCPSTFLNVVALGNVGASPDASTSPASTCPPPSISWERTRARELLCATQGRIAVTADIWTSDDRNRGYLAVKAHFVDQSWTLQSHLLR